MVETAKKKRTYTDEQRERNAARLREYRKAHPDRVRAWRDAYILRRAARLQAEAEARGGADCGGN